jgi:uncharacterized protein YecT (DUF1311 family)
MPADMRALGLLILLAGPAVAEGAFDSAPTSSCHAGGGGIACVGLAAQACMAQDAADTAGMTACLQAEADWWQDTHDAAYAAAMMHMQGRDSATWDDPPPSMAEALRDMQRAWLAYRTARCDLVRLRWWESPGAAAQGLICDMQVTAEQVAVLEDLVAPP